jgi:ABC-type lipoprotein release transport system permease subunit
MSATWLWARSDLRRRWLSVLALTVLVALATGSTLAFVAGARRAGSAIDRYEDATDMPDAAVFSTSEPSSRLMDALHGVPQIASIERTDAAVVVPEPMGVGQALTLIAADDNPAVVGRAMLIAGRYLTPGATDEILINERSAHDFDLHPGQRVQLESIACVARCGPEPAGEASIVGVVRLPPDLTNDPSSTAFALAGPNFLEGRWRSAMRPGTLLWLHLGDRRDTAAVIAEVSPHIGGAEISNVLALMQVADRAARLQREALFVAAVAVAMAGLLVTSQALARHLGGRGRDPQPLAAIGLDTRGRRTAALLAIGPALLLGLGGGIVVAVALSPIFPLGGARRADPDAGLHADLVVLGVGLAVAVLLLAAVAVMVAGRWARAGSDPPTEPRVSRLARVISAWGFGPVSATGSRFALEPGRGRSRLPIVPTIVALVASTAVLCGALVVRRSIDGLLAHGNRFGQSWALIVGAQHTDMDSVARSLATDRRVAGVALAAQGGVLLTSGDRTTHMTAIGLRGVDHAAPVTVLEGRAPASEDEIAVGSGSLRDLGLHVGDRTTMAGGCGQRDVTIVGRVAMPLVGTADPDDGTLLPLDTFHAVCSDQLVASIDSNTSVLVQLRHQRDAASLTQGLDPQQFLVRQRFVPGSVRAIEDLRQVPLVVAVLVGLLALTAAAHALALAVRRRRGDLAVLRALGLRPRQTAAVVRWQALTLATVAIVVGMPIGAAFGQVLWSTIAESSHFLPRTNTPAAGFALFTAATVAAAVALSWWPGHQASRVRPGEILRSE